MTHNVYLYILGMWLVSYLIRVLPLTLIRRQITNRTIRSFLYYVPYVTLAVMTFPAILSATQSPVSAWIALAAGLALAWFGGSLFQVSVACCAIVFVVELALKLWWMAISCWSSSKSLTSPAAWCASPGRAFPCPAASRISGARAACTGRNGRA